MGSTGITPELLQLLAGVGQQGPQQPAEQMSQQGQFNPADVQAQLRGGPQPFSFAPVPGGIGINLLNALANAGKAATYVAESPRERESDDARAQQLYETKQKMALAAGEFGQREQDRKEAATARAQQLSEGQKNRETQLKISQQDANTKAAQLEEEKRKNKWVEDNKEAPSDKAIHSYVGKDDFEHTIMQRKDNSTYELTSQSKTRPQQPNYGQLVLPTKTVDVIGPTGLPTLMGWNPQTKQYDKPVGTSATGAYGHEMAQAGAVARGGEQLIQDIQANRDQLGTLSAWVKQYGLNTPVADPKLANLQAKLATFAALQPAMHGFRSRNALETFENIIGGLQKNPDATIASIRGILQTTQAINPNLQQAQPTQQAAGQFKDGQTATGPGGHQIKFSQGQWVDAATGAPIK